MKGRWRSCVTHLGKSFAPHETSEENAFAPFSSLLACDARLFYSWAAFNSMAYPMGEGEEREAFTKGFS